MKRENIFWGLFFILAALFMLVGRLDFFEGLSFFKIFGTLLLVGWLGHSLSKRDYGGILFSIAFLCILYDEFLGIEELTPWPVLGAAMFGSIGLSMIFKKPYNCCEYNNYYDTNNSSTDNPYVEKPNGHYESVEETRDSQFAFSTVFSSHIKYVRSDNFKKANIHTSFGSTKVYFDDSMIQDGNATISLDVNFGGVELFIPKTWNVLNHSSCAFGAVEEKNRSCSTGSPTVVLTGNVAFGGVTIIYC